MSDSPYSADRRRFLVKAAVSLAAIPIVVHARADDLPKLAEDDSTAVALGYKHDAASVDTSKYPKRAGEDGAKQLCSNCALYQGDSEWAGCGIFPGKLVKAGGWCNAWAPRP